MGWPAADKGVAPVQYMPNMVPCLRKDGTTVRLDLSKSFAVLTNTLMILQDHFIVSKSIFHWFCQDFSYPRVCSVPSIWRSMVFQPIEEIFIAINKVVFKNTMEFFQRVKSVYRSIFMSMSFWSFAPKNGPHKTLQMNQLQDELESENCLFINQHLI